MSDIKIQWHPGFVAAVNLELKENRDDLQFEKEYNLNTKPLEVDLLVIKKNSGVQIENEIGRIFKGHNLLEYKSPQDHLDIDTFYKVTGYACLYKSYGETVDAVKADDITISLIRETKPQGLFKYFKEHGYSVSNHFDGIYYIDGLILFPTQIIVTEELNRTEHIWLGSLSDRMGRQDILELLRNIKDLQGKADREYADSVLDVSIGANEQIIRELKGDGSVSGALLKIMEPELRQIRLDGWNDGYNDGLNEGRNDGICGAVELLRDIGENDTEIKKAIIKKYNLSEKEADEYINWN